MSIRGWSDYDAEAGSIAVFPAEGEPEYKVRAKAGLTRALTCRTRGRINAVRVFLAETWQYLPAAGNKVR